MEQALRAAGTGAGETLRAGEIACIAELGTGKITDAAGARHWRGQQEPSKQAHHHPKAEPFLL